MTPPLPSSEPAASFELPAFTGDALFDLERLLDAESGYLSNLDLNGIEAIATSKEQLLASLRQTPRDAKDQPRLLRIRDKAIKNQLLTVHARETIASILMALAPSGPNYSATSRAAPAPGARLNVKV
jgi:flagellar biosynthesis/type III secretory pathway chaperone